MLDSIYGQSQNYSKTRYEIHAHLTEVCGVFAKHCFKRNDEASAREFLPKMFAWAVALLKNVRPDKTDLEDVILRKFPTACPYCGGRPCKCWLKEKPTLNDEAVRRLFFQNATSARRSLNDFQAMFRSIYESSGKNNSEHIFIRMMEELAELAEAMRFHHLYPENFENELADYFAWWFALVSTVRAGNSETVLLAEDCLWEAYPGLCPACQMIPCYCRPGFSGSLLMIRSWQVQRSAVVRPEPRQRTAAAAG